MDRKNKTGFFHYLAMNTLWNNAYSNSFQYCLLILPNIQCILWLLNFMFQTLVDYDRSFVTQNLWKLVNILILKDRFEEVSTDSVLIFWHCVTWLYFFLISILLVFVAKNYLQRQELSQKTQFIIFIIFQFHLAYGFVFTAETLIEPLVSPQSRINLAIALKTQEWVIIACNIVLLTANYLIGCFAALFSYDPFVSSNVLSSHSQNFQTLTLLFKGVIIPLLYMRTVADHFSGLFVMLSLAILLIRHYCLVTSCPYYSYFVMKLAVILSTICLSVAFMNVIYTIAKEYMVLTAEGMFYVQVLLAALAAIFSNYNFDQRMLGYITYPNKPLRTEKDIFEKFLSIQYLTRKLTLSLPPYTPYKTKELYFWGLYMEIMKNNEIYHHTEIENLMLSTNSKIVLQKLIAEFNNRYMQQFLKEVEKRDGQINNKTTILMISLLFDSIKTLPACIIYFSRLSKLDIFDRLIISKLDQKIQNNIRALFHQEEASQGLNIKLYIDGEALSKEFIDALCLNANQYIDFWTYYQDKNVKMQNLYTKSVHIEKQYDKIQLLWRNKFEHTKHLAYSMVPAYSIYLSLVRSRPVSATKLTQKWMTKSNFPRRKNEEAFISQEELASLNYLIISVSMSKENIGKIISASPQAIKVLGWSQKELLGQNINVLLPAFTRTAHDRLLENYVTKIKQFSTLSRINQILDSFVVNKEGFILPCEVYLSLYPYTQADLIFTAIVKVKTTNEGLILLNEDGFIEGANELVSKKLGLAQSRKTHMQDICQDYNLLESMFSSLPQKRMTEMEKIESYSPKSKMFGSLCLKSLQTCYKKGVFEEFDSTQFYHQYMGDVIFYVLKLNLSAGKKYRSDSPGNTEQGNLQTEEKKDFAEIFGHRSSKSTSSSENFNLQLEQAIEVNAKDKKFAFLKLAGVVFIILIPLTLLWLQIAIEGMSSMVAADIEVIIQTTLLRSKTVELNRMARLVVASDSGLVDPTKYNVTDPKSAITGPILDYSYAIHRLSNGIKASFDNIDPELRTLAYNIKIPMYENDVLSNNITTRYGDIFSFLTELTAKGIKVGNTPVAKLNKSDPDIRFILENTLNDFILAGERVRPIIISDCKIKMEKQQNLVLPIFVVISCGGLFILLILFKLVREFIQEMAQLLGCLFRLNQKNINNHILQVQKFEKALERGYLSSTGILNIDRSLFQKSTISHEDPKFIRKSVKMESINVNFVRCGLLIMIFLILFLSIYPIHLIILNSQKTAVMNKVNLITQSDDYLYQFVLLSDLCYQYIQENGTTMFRNHPIKQEIDELFVNLTKAQHFFGSSLLKKGQSFAHDTGLLTLLMGDLCSLFNASVSVQSRCPLDKGGMLTKGVIGMNSVILSVLQQIIDSFDASPRAFDDMYTAINNPEMYSVEYIQYFYLYQTYSAINKILKTHLEDDLEYFERVYGILNTLFSLAAILVGLTSWHYAIETFENEITNWMKMIRQIPWEVLMGNKLLKGYLIKQSKSNLK